MAKATNVKVYRHEGRTLIATWDWGYANTDHYTVRWWYITYLGIPILAEEKDVSASSKNCSFTMPSDPEPTKVWFHVKPVSTTHKVNDEEVAYWTADWSNQVSWYDTIDLPNTPSVPTVEIKDYTLTATVDNFDRDQGILNNYIEFQIVKDNSKVFDTKRVQALFTHASIECSVDPGSEYKVRCRMVQYPGKLTNPNWAVRSSDWTEFSSNVSTKPASTNGFTSCRAASKTSVYLSWDAVPTATSYDIEYATSEDLNITGSVSGDIGSYFNSSANTKTVNGIKDTTVYTISGLESGHVYYFRLRAVNEHGESSWSSVSSVTIGTTPQAPTTWSSTTTVIVGEPLILYWVHNSEDNSSQTYAELETIANGVTRTDIIRNSTDEDEKDKTSTYTIDTSAYSEGASIQWRVRTAGVTNELGEWSVQRKVDIYAKPTATLAMNKTPTSDPIDTVTSFPFYVSVSTQPASQKPTGYHLSIVANETYETVDSIGGAKIVNAGEEVYSKYFDISTVLLVEFSANNLDLENNIGYTVKCIASMDSGLTAEATKTFVVAWTEEMVEPNAEIGIDPSTISAYIRPYCSDSDGNPIIDVVLSVYRREFDGGFTKIATNVENTRTINDEIVQNIVYVTDPHPALDYARYRIVATSKTTGAVSYYDVPAYPVGEKAVIIQWNETWSNFDADGEGVLAQQPWTGSILRLPYNIDVSDKYDQDVSLVQYIGRKRPVSYYGTQLGESSTWGVEIDKSDKETLYALRRLAIWTGDVYVREPSGSGYWANINISFGQKHKEVTIPVTIDITRVEGGM